MQTTASSTSHLVGLNSAEVQERVSAGATNDFKARVGRTYRQIVIENVFNLFNIVLFSLLLFVLLLGDYITVVFAGFSVVSNTFLGMIQEINAKRRLDQLATLSVQKVAVLRGNTWESISMYDVVRDDILKIEPGDKLVVDGVVIQGDSLEIDESLLTGESDAVYKEAGAEVFSGSFCIAGSGVMRATRVGAESNINKLTVIAKAYKRVKTPTQTLIDIIVQITVVIMFALVPMLFISAIVNNLTLLEALRNVVVFVTTLVPQGLVLVAILSLTIGAIKITMQRTLVQRVNAVESLGNATVLCFDKTGTLTKNQLAVTEIISLNNTSQETIAPAIAAYLAHLSHLNRTAGAVQEYVQAQAHALLDVRKVREVPFTSGRKWGAVVFEDTTYVMGAPERLLPNLTGGGTLSERVMALSSQGYRVLAFARVKGEIDPANIIHQTEPIALIVLSDQPRENIQETLKAFMDEKIGLKVVSGDSLETVRAIAEQSGMTITGAMLGADVDKMSDGELVSIIEDINVFARVEPETKQRIVSALQARGHYVAMVGDGVNDVPALKQAQLAIVMNDGTQISKDVADIVLLDNAMSTLPLAFREGREITQTVFGTMKIFLVKNLYNILLFLFIAFMSLPFPFTPVQISWSTFGTVNMPATLVAFGILRPTYMKRFREDVLDFILTGAVIGSLGLAIVYAVTYFSQGLDVLSARTAVTLYVTLYGAYIICVIMGVDFYQPQTFRQNLRLILIMIGFTVFTVLMMYAIPPLFNFVIFHPVDDFLVIALITVVMQLSMVLLSHGVKYPHLLQNFWRLFHSDLDKVGLTNG